MEVPIMYKLVLHVEHFKKGNLSKLENHNSRKYLHDNNKNIRPELSKNNIQFIDHKGTLTQDVKARTNQRSNNKRAIRSDANLISEIVVGADDKFFENLCDQRKIDFGKTATKLIQERYGKENVLRSYLHLDEVDDNGIQHPGLHVDVVPMTKTGKLSSDALWKRKELHDFHTYMAKGMQANGFQLERGEEDSRAKHVDPNVYKATMAKFDSVAHTVASSIDEFNKDKEKFNKDKEAFNKNEEAFKVRELRLDDREDNINFREDGADEEEQALTEREIKDTTREKELADERRRLDERTHNLVAFAESLEEKDKKLKEKERYIKLGKEKEKKDKAKRLKQERERQEQEGDGLVF